MTKLLEQALDAMRRLPPSRQDDIAQAILIMADGALEAIEAKHLPFVLEGLAEIERGEFATEEEIASAFRSFDR